LTTPTSTGGKRGTAYGSMVNYDGSTFALFDVLIMGHQSFFFSEDPQTTDVEQQFGRASTGDCDATVSVCTARSGGQPIQLWGHCVRYDIFFNPDTLQYWVRRAPGGMSCTSHPPNCSTYYCILWIRK
jgi:hypothetical protein